MNTDHRAPIETWYDSLNILKAQKCKTQLHFIECKAMAYWTFTQGLIKCLIFVILITLGIY
jgi:hypothetical protein